MKLAHGLIIARKMMILPLMVALPQNVTRQQNKCKSKIKKRVASFFLVVATLEVQRTFLPTLNRKSSKRVNN